MLTDDKRWIPLKNQTNYGNKFDKRSSFRCFNSLLLLPPPPPPPHLLLLLLNLRLHPENDGNPVRDHSYPQHPKDFKMGGAW
jgi:hypothetical protein